MNRRALSTGARDRRLGRGLWLGASLAIARGINGKMLPMGERMVAKRR
jgi:hypothetical protein